MQSTRVTGYALCCTANDVALHGARAPSPLPKFQHLFFSGLPRFLEAIHKNVVAQE